MGVAKLRLNLKIWEGKKYFEGDKIFGRGCKRAIDEWKIERVKKRSPKKFRGTRQKCRGAANLRFARAADTLATPLIRVTQCNMQLFR